MLQLLSGQHSSAMMQHERARHKRQHPEGRHPAPPTVRPGARSPAPTRRSPGGCKRPLRPPISRRCPGTRCSPPSPRLPSERMKMGDLAEALVITRGGLTKLVDRLIKAGLLERTFCETDRRVSYATLMPAGARPARRDAPRRRRRAQGRLCGKAQRRRSRQPCARRWSESASQPAVRVRPRRRSFGGLDQASSSVSRPSRISSTGSGSPLTIPSKNSLRSW